MIGSGEAESRAVAGAVKGAVGQVRLDAGVNIAGLLVDIDRADSVDCRRYFMCWHLTRILGPSLTEMVLPTVVRRVVGEDTAAAVVRGEVGAGLQRRWDAVTTGTVKDVGTYASATDHRSDRVLCRLVRRQGRGRLLHWERT